MSALRTDTEDLHDHARRLSERLVQQNQVPRHVAEALAPKLAWAIRLARHPLPRLTAHRDDMRELWSSLKRVKRALKAPSVVLHVRVGAAPLKRDDLDPLKCDEPDRPRCFVEKVEAMEQWAAIEYRRASEALRRVNKAKRNKRPKLPQRNRLVEDTLLLLEEPKVSRTQAIVAFVLGEAGFVVPGERGLRKLLRPRLKAVDSILARRRRADARYARPRVIEDAPSK